MKIKLTGEETKPIGPPHKKSALFYQFEVDEPISMPLFDEILLSLIRLIRPSVPNIPSVLVISQLKDSGKKFTKLEAFWLKKSPRIKLPFEISYDLEKQTMVLLVDRLDREGKINKTWPKVIELDEIEE